MTKVSGIRKPEYADTHEDPLAKEAPLAYPERLAVTVYNYRGTQELVSTFGWEI